MKDCNQCRKWGTMNCPNSNECYALDDKPHFESRLQTIFDELGKDMDRLVELFGEIKRRAKSIPRKSKSYISPYAKFDKYHHKKKK